MDLTPLIQIWRHDRDALVKSTDPFYRAYGHALGDAADELTDWLKVHYQEGPSDTP
jgi:hypothetical protein